MDLGLVRSGDVPVIRVGEERIDSATAIQFKEGLRALADRADARAGRLILDMGSVGFVAEVQQRHQGDNPVGQHGHNRETNTPVDEQATMQIASMSKRKGGRHDCRPPSEAGETA